ncbi:hypothetical protein FB451DRAFT_1570239 [Mycena latifolia]|nr:hypothetical protein FB451DRAFT_1570239 [Mycena latifolia]
MGPQEEDLTLRLHFLASLHGDELRLPASQRKTVESRDGFDQSFAGQEANLPTKYIRALQAVSTLCTIAPGENNFALMLGHSNQETHLFFAQNEGENSEDIASHLHSLWNVLRQINEATNTSNDPSLVSPPRTNSPLAPQFIKKLFEISYRFVSDKALHRAKKRLQMLQILSTRSKADTTANKTQSTLMRRLWNVASAAKSASNIAAKYRFRSQAWLDFLSGTRLLYDTTLWSAYPAAVQRLQELAGTSFNLQKSLDKLLKVELAGMTLHALAISPRRSWIVRNGLKVHAIPSPQKYDVSFPLANIQQGWCPPATTREDVISRMIKYDGTLIGDRLRLLAKIHSECLLVAWLSQNLGDFEITLVPYMTCSKLHCFACYIWLELYNNLNNPTLPRVYYDGLHGGLKPGWEPPKLDAVSHAMVLTRLSQRLEAEFTKFTHGKEGSAPSTSSDPQVFLSRATEAGLEWEKEVLKARGLS